MIYNEVGKNLHSILTLKLLFWRIAGYFLVLCIVDPQLGDLFATSHNFHHNDNVDEVDENDDCSVSAEQKHDQSCRLNVAEKALWIFF